MERSSLSKPSSVRHRLGDWLGLFARGTAMGMGDAVPGVSGGTIAVITGVYERLLFSIRSFDLKLVALLLKGRWHESWLHVQGPFVLALGSGILFGLLISANSVLYLLENHRPPLMGLFIGLILATVYLLRRRGDWAQPGCWVALLLGVGMTALVAQTGDLGLAITPLSLFFVGMIAISAMILPGLSGAFILLLLGAYEPVLTALVNLEWFTIIVFAAGCASGLLVFSRVLVLMLERAAPQTYSLVLGLLIGSLQLLWPWQLVQNDSEKLKLVSPDIYAQTVVGSNQLLSTAFALFAGFVLVVALHRFSTARPAPES